MKISVLATALATIGCGLAVTMISCNSDKNDIANVPTQPAHGPKAPQALTNNCDVTTAVSRCGLGAATLSLNGDEGTATAANLNAVTDGVSSTFAAGHNWKLALDANAPTGGQQLTATAYSAGAEESELDAVSNAAGQLHVTPTFLAGNGRYTIEVYNNGVLVASKANVPSGVGPILPSLSKFWQWIKFHVRFSLGVPAPRTEKGAHVESVEAGDIGACVWEISDVDGPAVSITAPDGSVVQGNEIRFIETVDGSGRYPYHSVDRVDVKTNIGTYKVVAEYAGG